MRFLLLVAFVFVCVSDGTVLAAPPKDEAALLRALNEIAGLRERLIQLSISSSYMQDGRVKLLRYTHQFWPEATRKAEAYQKAVAEIVEAPLRLFMERRLVISRIEAFRRWGQRTAITLPHAYKETMVEIRPIIPGLAKTQRNEANFPRND